MTLEPGSESIWSARALGLLRLQTNRADQGIAECERGLAIDGNHPHAHALIGVEKLLYQRLCWLLIGD